MSQSHYQRPLRILSIRLFSLTIGAVLYGPGCRCCNECYQ
jgi:hypothetical protein